MGWKRLASASSAFRLFLLHCISLQPTRSRAIYSWLHFARTRPHSSMMMIQKDWRRLCFAWFLGLYISPRSIVFGWRCSKRKVLRALRLEYVTEINWPWRPGINPYRNYSLGQNLLGHLYHVSPTYPPSPLINVGKYRVLPIKREKKNHLIINMVRVRREEPRLPTFFPGIFRQESANH